MLKANGKKECKSVQMQQKWVLISETSIILFTMVNQEIQTIWYNRWAVPAWMEHNQMNSLSTKQTNLKKVDDDVIKLLISIISCRRKIKDEACPRIQSYKYSFKNLLREILKDI